MVEMESSHFDDDDDDDTNTTYVPVPIEEDRSYVPNYDWIGDTYCDDGNNNPAYYFDGGDCCVDAYIKKGKDNDYCAECRCKTMKLDLKIGYGKGFASNALSQGKNNVEKYIKDIMI